MLNLRDGEEKRLWAAISQNPRQVSTYRRLARLLQQRRRPKEAADVVRLATERGMADRELKVLLADLYAEAGERRRAIRAYRDLLREKPQDFLIYERLERIYRETGKDRETIKMLSSVSADNPQKARALKRLISLHKESGELKSALRCLKLLLEKSGPDFTLYQEMGRLYQRSGNLGRAIHFYGEARKMQPRDLDIALLLGVCQRKAGRRKKARQTFTETLRIKPGFYGGHIHLAEMEIEDGDFVEAEKHLRRLDAAFPNNSRVKINRAHILLKKGAPRQAFQLAREGSKETPFYYTDELSLGHAVLAGACEELGQREEADYHRLTSERVSGSSDFFRTIIKLIDELVGSARLSLAEKVVEGLLERFPGNSLACLKKAEIRRHRGDWEGALSLGQQASRESNPRYLKDKIRALEFLSELYQERNEPEKARAQREFAAQLAFPPSRQR